MKKKFGVDFWLFRCSQMVIKTGYYSSSFAVIWWVLDKYHSASYVTVILASSMLVGMGLRVVLSPLGDRLDKKTIVLFGTFIQLISYFIILLLLYTSNLSISFILIAEICSAIGSSFVEIGSIGMLPMLVKRDDILDATKIIASLDSIVTIIGAPLGGVLLTLFGPIYSFLFYTLSLLTSLILVILMKLSTPKNKETKIIKKSFYHELKIGFYITFKNKITRTIFAFSVFIGISFSCLQIIVPYIIKVVNNLQADYLGLIVSSLGVGVVFSSITISTLMGIIKNKKIIYFASLLFVVSSLIILFSTNPYAYMLAYFFIGISKNVINIIIDSNLLIFLPKENRTKILSNIVFCSNLTMPIALIFSGEVIDKVGPNALMSFIVFIFIISFFIIFTSSDVGDFLDADSKSKNIFFDTNKE